MNCLKEAFQLRGNKMGVPHLESLRDYLRKNPNRTFTKTNLRNALLQNYNTINQNMDYLIYTEMVAVEIKEEGKATLFQWR